MSKRTKASKKRINDLIILLVLVAVLLIMSTYAWFTANRTVNINSIDVKVSTSTGLQISADGETWKTVLEKKDIIDAKNNGYSDAINQLPDYMSPVSTDGTLKDNGRFMNMYHGVVSADLTGNPSDADYGEYKLTATQPEGTSADPLEFDTSAITSTAEDAKGHFIAFDIFIKSGADSDDLYMSGNIGELQVPAGGTTKTIVTDRTKEKGITNAARVALVKGENRDTADTTTIRSLSTAGGKVMIWEPNFDWHTARGVENATSLGWGPANLGAGGKQTDNTTDNPRITYSGIKTAFSDGVLLKNATQANDSSKFSDVTPDWFTKKDDIVSLQMPDSSKVSGKALQKGVTKYRIYFWVEGQDVDCENFASGSEMVFSLSFSLDEVTSNPSIEVPTTTP